jgi:3-deoxy-D-manno-octulosonic acid kinase
MGGEVQAERWQEGGHVVLHDPAALPQPRAEMFDPAYWEAAGRVVGRAAGRGAVLFVRAGDEGRVWALRHYRRGGWAGRIVEDRYLWLGLTHTRPWREFHLTRELHDKGLPVPVPVAAHVARSGPTYRGDLITQRIAGAEPLADVLLAGAMPAAHWSQLGRVLRRFHLAGVRHDDINARNVLRDARGVFHVIDFDKACLLPLGDWQAQNLARFQRSLLKHKAAQPGFHFAEPDWQALLSGYQV